MWLHPPLPHMAHLYNYSYTEHSPVVICYLLVTLEVARNHRNFCCARSWVAILLASLIFINSWRRQTKHTLANSMLCSSVVKAFFYSKTWYRDRRRLVMSEYVENSISKNWSNVCILTSTTTYVVLYTDITYTQNIHVYWYMHGG